MTGATVNRQNVFIGGAPRSGTTLLGSILGSHSQMLATPESQFKFELTPLFNEAPPLKEKVSEFINRHPRFATRKCRFTCQPQRNRFHPFEGSKNGIITAPVQFKL